MKHSCDGQYLFVGPCYVFGTTLHLSQVMRGHLTSHYSPREQGMPKKNEEKKTTSGGASQDALHANLRAKLPTRTDQ